MPTHAILVTYKDMEAGEVISEFVSKAQVKYAANFKQLYFDSGTLTAKLYLAVSAVPAADRLKIYLSGHGGTGVDHITNDAKNKKQTLGDLAKLLAYALRERATDPNTSANSEVNMISCLFGRTTDGGTDNSPAVKLHRELVTRGICVDLVARTESIIVMPGGARTTISPSNRHYVAPDQLAAYTFPKVQYTKIRCTFVGGSPIVKLRAYESGDDVYIQADSLAGRRSLWADHAVDVLMKQINGKPTANGANITDARERVLKGILDWYSTNRSPALLQDRLRGLVDGEGVGVEDFTTHRNVLSSLFSNEPPKKSVVVRELLRTYPR